MKAVLASLAVLVAAASQAQMKMSLSVNGEPLGTATISQKVDQAGHLKQTIHMSIDFHGITSTVDTSIETDRTGRPILEKSTESHGSDVTTTALNYLADSLEVSRNESGKPEVLTIDYPKGNLADASAVWFVTITPNVNATTTYVHYDLPSKSWQTKSATYVGDETVPETQRKGHHIHHDDGELWVDDKGLPIRIELTQAGVKMVLRRL